MRLLANEANPHQRREAHREGIQLRPGDCLRPQGWRPCSITVAPVIAEWNPAPLSVMVSAGARCLGVARAESTAVNRFARRYLGFVSLRASVRPSRAGRGFLAECAAGESPEPIPRDSRTVLREAHNLEIRFDSGPATNAPWPGLQRAASPQQVEALHQYGQKQMHPKPGPACVMCCE